MGQQKDQAIANSCLKRLLFYYVIALVLNAPPEQRKTLAEAAEEIQQLLHQLQQKYSPKTPLEKQMVVTEAIKQIEENPPLKARVIAALKAGGIEALRELVDNPLINILVAALEGWQEVE